MSKTDAANKSLTLVLNDKEDIRTYQQTATESYIIDSNKRLQEENIELKLAVSILEKSVEELEEEISTEEKRNKYIKNVMKNFHEIHKNMDELNSVEYDINTKTYKLITEIMPIIILITSIALSGFWYIYPFFIPLGVFGFKLRYDKLTSGLFVLKSKLEDDIKEIESGQDYIYEFIENC